MELKDRMIIEDYRRNLPALRRCCDMVQAKLDSLVRENNISAFGVQARVKTEESLEGKIFRKGDGYQNIFDITDLMGARIICYFSDEVDVVGDLINKNFVVDWDCSSDKRALIAADSFGYLSLHYICYLREEMLEAVEDEESREFLSKLRFEVQIRTILQHAWAAIYHDLGYKSEFGVPRPVFREFSRIAGLLETADEEFVRARNAQKDYSRETREKIQNDTADDVLLDVVSLNAFVSIGHGMQNYLSELCEMAGVELYFADAESYLPQLRFFGIENLGDMKHFLENNKALALKLCKDIISVTDLDIMVSNAALRFLCQAELIRSDASLERMQEFFTISARDDDRALRQAKRLMNRKNALEQ